MTGLSNDTPAEDMIAFSHTAETIDVLVLTPARMALLMKKEKRFFRDSITITCLVVD